MADEAIQKRYKKLLEKPETIVILDTETTGIDESTDQPVSIAIIDGTGKTLFNRLVNPTIAIHPDAQEVHGISKESLKDAATFADLVNEINALLKDKTVIVYNANYDRSMLLNAAKANNVRVENLRGWHCAMRDYASYNGTQNNWGNPKWWKLTDACTNEGIEVKDAHDALGDVRMTLALIKSMAGLEEKTDTAIPSQPTLIDLPKYKIGDLVVIGNKGGNVVKVSEDGKRIQVSYALIDGESKRWHDITEVNGNNEPIEAGHALPDEPDIDDLQKSMNKMAAEMKTLKEELERQKTLVLVANRQRDEAKAETAKAKSEQPTHKLPEAGEVLSLKSEIERLKVENTRLETKLRRPPVEVQSMIRMIQVAEGTKQDDSLLTWLKEGWSVVPGLTHLIKSDGSMYERIIFQRINQPSTQPIYPSTIAEIDTAFNTQGNRNDPLLQRNGAGGMPLTDLMRQGYSTDAIKDTMDTQALARGRAAGLASAQKRDLTHIGLLTAPEVVNHVNRQ